VLVGKAPPAIVTSADSVSVRQGSTAIFGVKLSSQPDSAVTVMVRRVSGDSDIMVTGGSSLTFATSNWDTYQTVTLSVAQDVEPLNGSATIRCTALGLVDKDVTATQQDDTYVLHDWSGDGIVSIVGDVPPFVRCVYFGTCPDDMDTIAVGDCSGDGILSIVGDVPCFVECVYFDNCPD
jgi:hypothetical protein